MFIHIKIKIYVINKKRICLEKENNSFILTYLY